MSTEIESLELEIISNSKSAVQGIDALTQSLSKLKNATKGGLGLSAVSKELKKVSKSNKESSLSFTDLFHVMKTVAKGIKKVGSEIYSAIEKSMDYTENMNLFSVAMGEYADSAYKYAEEVSEAMGIDTSEWIRAQGVFMTLSTGFGVASDRANKMSQNLTQLGYDLASFYNIDVEDAMLKLQSGLSGELEPLRRLGYDLSQAKLEATALALGIDKSVSSMTQAEKAQLRYYAIMTQVTKSHGDMAKTLNDPANQMRVFKAEINMAAREIGNVFIPALNAIMPYAIAVTKVIGILAKTIAGLFGSKDTGIRESSNAVVNNTGAMTENLGEAKDEAKKLKSYMLGIDELNVINPDTDTSAVEDIGDMFDFDLPEYDFMEKLTENKVGEIVEDMKEWLGLTEDIESWSDLLATNFGNIAVSVGLIGTGFAAWGISKLVKNFGKLKKAFDGFSIFFKAIGIAAVSMVAIAGAAWLITNTEDTITKLGGILSAAALVVGAVLAFTGINLPLGIALMAVGAVSMGTAIAMNTDLLSGDIREVVAGIAAAVSGALLVVGAILAFTGVNIPLGIALMAGGALTLGTAIAPSWNTLSDSTQEIITGIMGIVGGALLALGAILAFTGANIPLGIGLMATGALSLGGAIALNWESMSGDIEGIVTTLTTIVGGALLALGAVLAFTGANIPLGIGLMVAGAVTLGSSIAMNTDLLSDDVKEVIAVITSAVSVALLAVGAILAFTGANIPLGIALMAGGALALGGAIVPNWGTLSESVQETISIILAAVGGALLVVGAILAFSGVGIPLGIGLMLVGAASLGTAIALNWDSIVDALQGPVGLITGIISGALLVLGAILLFTGVGIPLGIGLMLAGAAGLGTVVAVNWDFLVDKIKGIWEAIKTFWNTYIAPIFTAKWWTDLGKTCINGLISGFEGGINGIIGAFESMINWIVDGLNKISIDIPDWVPGVGGQTWGINIPRASFGRVSIPRLAEGGFPETGQMFIAREAGAEMVGNIGRRTAVANNDQIVSGIAGGVAEANEEQNVLLREQNSLLRAILEKDSGVYLDGKNLTNSVEKYQRERGRVLITGGVI